jgi:hypothetical protein
MELEATKLFAEAFAVRELTRTCKKENYALGYVIESILRGEYDRHKAESMTIALEDYDFITEDHKQIKLNIKLKEVSHEHN